ncbi:lipid-A-disaccharide synthase N-terminal domain-containing protein [Gillisia sp. M10.2A]|uniref:Lipid-A-disaccharide synthase N-terminal domain-containing protein n=1 Tax=Gillisia lutea TaxID=2909668 RepID=A0ABS9ED46_9FLAO|nr:lipid-A-disaccharide synthase N-terminal domain-containing protein [Gillisia lutea]MCF4100806.1 lipid-A-disaccharide synthase N-terminal domain-containing protein [Gillisia lutea]
MSDWIIYSVGFTAQLLFSARLITQWFLSEKAKEVQTPSIFWKLSLIASILLFVYGFLREDLAIMLGQLITYTVYIRNLQLQKEWSSSNVFLKILVIGFPIALAGYLLFLTEMEWKQLVHGENIALWLIILGVIGQIVYTLRFIYQWLYSEKNKESSLPKGFWILSLMGSIIIFTYAIFRDDPVLLAAHFFGGIVYIRNLYIMKKSKAK